MSHLPKSHTSLSLVKAKNIEFQWHYFQPSIPIEKMNLVGYCKDSSNRWNGSENTLHQKGAYNFYSGCILKHAALYLILHGAESIYKQGIFYKINALNSFHRYNSIQLDLC